jgi:RHS repeat-associated protein
LPGRGTITGLVDSAGTVGNSYRYSPWGQLEDSTEIVANTLRFAGREYDTVNGHYYNRARFYDPHLGRFLSEDPIGTAGGINLYAFASSDPISFRDPFGLCPQELRNEEGTCPGGLSVSEWDAGVSALPCITDAEAVARLGSKLRRGLIRPF